MKFQGPVQSNDPQPPNHPLQPAEGLLKLKSFDLSQSTHLVDLRKLEHVESDAVECVRKATLLEH